MKKGIFRKKLDSLEKSKLDEEPCIGTEAAAVAAEMNQEAAEETAEEIAPEPTDTAVENEGQTASAAAVEDGAMEADSAERAEEEGSTPAESEDDIPEGTKIKATKSSGVGKSKGI